MNKESIIKVQSMLFILICAQILSIVYLIWTTADIISGVVPNQPFPQVFGDNSNSVALPFVLLFVVLIETAILIIAMRYKFLDILIKFIFIMGMSYGVFVFIDTIAWEVFGYLDTFHPIAILLFIISAMLLWKHPEWYVIDTIGLIMCAMGIALLGSNIGIVPIIVMLIIFACYDAYAVYKSRHMIDLAIGVLNLKLPMIFIIPRDLKYSFIDSGSWKDIDNIDERAADFIGMGDIVFPSLLFISCIMAFKEASWKLFGFLPLPAIGAIVGSWIGMVVLMWYADNHPKSHAGLPILNGCTIGGFVVMYLLMMVV